MRPAARRAPLMRNPRGNDQTAEGCFPLGCSAQGGARASGQISVRTRPPCRIAAAQRQRDGDGSRKTGTARTEGRGGGGPPNPAAGDARRGPKAAHAPPGHGGLAAADKLRAGGATASRRRRRTSGGTPAQAPGGPEPQGRPDGGAAAPGWEHGISTRRQRKTGTEFLLSVPAILNQQDPSFHENTYRANLILKIQQIRFHSFIFWGTHHPEALVSFAPELHSLDDVPAQSYHLPVSGASAHSSPLLSRLRTPAPVPHPSFWSCFLPPYLHLPSNCSGKSSSGSFPGIPSPVDTYDFAAWLQKSFSAPFRPSQPFSDLFSLQPFSERRTSPSKPRMLPQDPAKAGR